MTRRDARSMTMVLAIFVAVLALAPVRAQAPPPGGQAPAGPGRGRGGRGGPALPGASPEQIQAVTAMNASLADEVAALAEARENLTGATFAGPKNLTAISAALSRVGAAERALALKRAAAFAELQSGPNKLNEAQIAALAASAANTGGRGRGGPPARGAGPAPGTVPPGR